MVQSSSPQAVIDYLTDYKQEREQRLIDLQDIDSARTRLRNSIARQKEINDQIDNLETLLKSDTGLLDQLDGQTGALIYSVNSNFSSVPALNDLSVIEACRHFATSLGQDNGQLTIGGAVIPNVLFTEHNAEAIRSKRLEQIKSLELESNKLEQQILKTKSSYRVTRRSKLESAKR